ncbi:MAG: hypothetical protein MUC58_01405 [Rhizobiaceae bacterium]|nr:hypothetical protein [Rhizobiaceae bacterium]
MAFRNRTITLLDELLPRTIMKPNADEIATLAETIASSEVRLQRLEKDIREIGQPAASELQRRLEALKVEEAALKRNLAESLGLEDPSDKRLARIEKLMDHISREESAMEEETGFLQQAAPTSMELIARTGNRLKELCVHAIRRVFGEHPLGESVFVNHSHQLLAERYGYKTLPPMEKPGKL